MADHDSRHGKLLDCGLQEAVGAPIENGNLLSAPASRAAALHPGAIFSSRHQCSIGTALQHAPQYETVFSFDDAGKLSAEPFANSFHPVAMKEQ
jgi:hypothetical protein